MGWKGVNFLDMMGGLENEIGDKEGFRVTTGPVPNDHDCAGTLEDKHRICCGILG